MNTYKKPLDFVLSYALCDILDNADYMRFYQLKTDLSLLITHEFFKCSLYDLMSSNDIFFRE
ncbi:MAG: hypothetical protein Wins2KO_03990 [Winogradskyella sp.]